MLHQGWLVVGAVGGWWHVLNRTQDTGRMLVRRVLLPSHVVFGAFGPSLALLVGHRIAHILTTSFPPHSSFTTSSSHHITKRTPLFWSPKPVVGVLLLQHAPFGVRPRHCIFLSTLNRICQALELVRPFGVIALYHGAALYPRNSSLYFFSNICDSIHRLCSPRRLLTIKKYIQKTVPFSRPAIIDRRTPPIQSSSTSDSESTC